MNWEAPNAVINSLLSLHVREWITYDLNMQECSTQSIQWFWIKLATMVKGIDIHTNRQTSGHVTNFVCFNHTEHRRKNNINKFFTH